MRYEPSQRLLRLALMLAGTRTGLTLDEIARELEIGRRTAERLRDALAELFPKLEAWEDEARVRRWRLPGTALAGVAEPRAEALAAVEASAREYEARGDADRAALLREAAATSRALMNPTALRRAEPDVAALMEAEGIAMRPGPRPKLLPELLPTLRRAILGVQPVAVRYANLRDAEPAARVLYPYGILYGGRGWLVAQAEDFDDVRVWRLDRIRSIELLDRGFTRRDDFDLRAYAARSFGVWQEEPMDVVLRFAPEAAEDAAGWLFHTSQTTDREEDGSLVVRFRAGGMREMCWHLFTWGLVVVVVEPAQLRDALAATADAVRLHHMRLPDGVPVVEPSS